MRAVPLCVKGSAMPDAEHVAAPKPAVTTEGESTVPADKRSSAHRLLHILGAVVVAVVLPALLMYAFVGALGGSAMLVGFVLGVAGAKLGGTHRMVDVAPVIGIAAGLGALTAYDW